jgi:hypothetical protein
MPISGAVQRPFSRLKILDLKTRMGTQGIGPSLCALGEHS